MTQQDSAFPRFELYSVGIRATAEIRGDNQFVVLAGSQARAEVVESFAKYAPPGYQRQRQELIDACILRPGAHAGILEFTADHVFGGSTPAAVVILGRNADGTREWLRVDDGGDGPRQTHGEWLKERRTRFPVFTQRHFDLTAWGQERQGRFFVLEGSQFRGLNDRASFYSPEDEQLLHTLLGNGTLVPGAAGVMTLTRDTPFSDASQAARLVLLRATPPSLGWVTVDETGKELTLGEWRQTVTQVKESLPELVTTWRPYFQELAHRLLDFEERQPELVQILRDAGVHIQHDEGEDLQTLDPFSFFSLILKHQSDASVLPILGKIKQSLGLQAPVPTDLTGVPWSNPMNAWFFAYRSKRQPDDLPTLWALARQAVAGDLDPDTFQRALAIRKVALPKLTQGLFWLNPDEFLALNGVNNPYLEQRGIKSSRVTTLSQLQAVLDAARNLAPDFPTLSHTAWLASEQSKQEASLIDGHFPFQQFREEAGRFSDDRVKGNMVLDRRYAPLLLNLLGDLNLHSLTPARSPYTGKAQLTVKVNLGQGVKSDGTSFGRALLLPEAGFEYVPLPQGLTLEVGLPDGKGDAPRHSLRQPEVRERLLEALLAPAPTSSPATLSLTADFGPVNLQPLQEAQRSEVEAMLDQYVQGLGKSRRVRVGLTLSAAELEGETFAEVLEGSLSYLDRVMAVLEELSTVETPAPEVKVIQVVNMEEAPVTAAFTPPPGVPLNQILYGPPGTGKTYRVVDKALEVLDPEFLKLHQGSDPRDRQARKARYDDLAAQGRITFVTFHQNFGYEDFVEGIKPVMKGGNLSYELEDGLFLQAVKAANGEVNTAISADTGVNPHAQVWRIYIDGAAPVSQIRARTLQRGEVRVGSWGASVRDLTHEAVEQLSGQKLSFRDGIRPGDVILLATGADQIGGVGIVTSNYFFDTSEAIFEADYAHARKVHWLATDLQVKAKDIVGRTFSSQAVQRVADVTPAEVLERLHLKLRPGHLAGSTPVPHVLIIDEINRGNVAKVFGELITLLEPSKRHDAAEGLTVRLPLSKRPLSVPQSLYVIGTMNTADRSLTLLDAALRRRFVFEPVWPEPDVLPVIDIDGDALHLPQFLRAINTRIEKLLSREQVIGHAYLLDIPETLDGVSQALQQRILPLLEEYFFEDWGQIRQVLGDDQKPARQQFIREVTDSDVKRYERNGDAFKDIEAYVRTYSGTTEASEAE